MQEPALLADPRELADRVAGWPASAVLALDTEFMRERTFHPLLCLVQLAVAGKILLVDPLAIPGLPALAAPLVDPGRVKILHAARQDLEALLPVTGQPLAAVFDTQIAAGLLGFPAQIGYGELVRRLLGIELHKGHTRTDWTRRPLSREQLIYAAEDVAHLPALAELLDERLAAAGRRGWLDEEAAALTDPALYRADPEQAWRRLRGLERLDPQGRAVARTLAGWREERALARNLPRGWILADAALLELARLRPQTRVALAELEALPRGTIERQGDALLAAIAAAAIREDDLDSNGAGRPDAAQQQQLKVLQQRLAGIATELDIAPEVLATRRELAAIVRGTHDLPVLAGWRRSVVGEALLAAL